MCVCARVTVTRSAKFCRAMHIVWTQVERVSASYWLDHHSSHGGGNLKEHGSELARIKSKTNPKAAKKGKAKAKLAKDDAAEGGQEDGD